MTTNASSHTLNLRTAMPQNHTVWTKAQSNPGPHMDKTHAGRADMTAVDDPLQGDKSYGDQQRPPSGNRGGPNSLLENVIHGNLLPPALILRASSLSGNPSHGFHRGIQRGTFFL